jgi:hypothetical protein
MTLWLSELPTWNALLITAGLANAFAIATMLVSRRRWDGNGVAVVIPWATCAGALTSLLFAFTIASVWNGSAKARSNVDDEASAIRLVARDLAPAQLPLLREYVARTIAEWPRLCGASRDPNIERSLLSLQRTAKPRLPAYADDLYRQLSAMEDLRNRRWQAASASIPGEIWISLVVLSCALLCVLAIARPDRFDVHVALMIAVATALGTLSWVATVLEYPFCGNTGIGPREILDIVQAHLM